MSLGINGPRIVATGALKLHSSTLVEVVRMSVASDMRRRGIGGKILRFLLDHAKRADMERVVLETTATWAEVIRFYQKHGFQITHYEAGNAYFALDLDER